MITAKNLIIILILLIISNTIRAQKDLLVIHYNQFDVQDKKTSYRDYISYSNEAKQLASIFFLFYKEFISSQDMNTCVFYPSCSVYAMESIKKLGFLEGFVNAFDRLSRCHPLSQKYYPIDPETQKLYDPVPEK
jgi:putative membrane protein insertion efficiency factor